MVTTLDVQFFSLYIYSLYYYNSVADSLRREIQALISCA
jgi:hypothetical protein